eukprot:scaffold45426_cov174-Isochrysis_galbana.AAC.1
MSSVPPSRRRIGSRQEAARRPKRAAAAAGKSAVSHCSDSAMEEETLCPDSAQSSQGRHFPRCHTGNRRLARHRLRP